MVNRKVCGVVCSARRADRSSGVEALRSRRQKGFQLEWCMNLGGMGGIPALYAARLGRDHLCIVHQDDHLSWGDMATLVNRRASALKRLGIRKDDIVALVLPNENAVFELSDRKSVV